TGPPREDPGGHDRELHAFVRDRKRGKKEEDAGCRQRHGRGDKPAPREGDDRVAVEDKRKGASCKSEQLEEAEESRVEGEGAVEAAEARNDGEQDDREGQVSQRALAAAKPRHRREHSEQGEPYGDRILEEAEEALHQAAPRLVTVANWLMNTFTTSGSHCRCAPQRRIASASSGVLRERYGRSLISASNASHTETIRARRGIDWPTSR